MIISIKLIQVNNSILINQKFNWFEVSGSNLYWESSVIPFSSNQIQESSLWRECAFIASINPDKLAVCILLRTPIKIQVGGANASTFHWCSYIQNESLMTLPTPDSGSENHVCAMDTLVRSLTTRRDEGQDCSKKLKDKLYGNDRHTTTRSRWPMLAIRL